MECTLNDMVMYMDDIKPYHCKVHGYEKQLMQAQVVPLQASAEMKKQVYTLT
jgi:hypothetical protein